MASALKNLSQYDDSTIPSARELKFGIVVSEWNQEITHALYEGCVETLEKHGAQAENIFTLQVPGAFELTSGAKLCMMKHKVDAVICIGCVIQGETKHNDYINHAVASGLTTLGMASNIPCVYGVLTPNNMEQAQERSGGKYGNKGVEAGVTAIRMAVMKKEMGKTKSSIGFGK
ncbi:MAG: 6,7-dimethyl-8-ribityllumazine synthase [Bacteroidota bacterium]